MVFLEPYPKSYAKELHSDSIETDGENSGKVQFEPFLGISPYRYRELSLEKGRRKDDAGQVKRWNADEPLPIVEIYNPIYTKIETIIGGEITEQIKNCRCSVIQNCH